MNRPVNSYFLVALVGLCASSMLGAPGIGHAADTCPFNGTGVVRACINSNSNAGVRLDLTETPQWSIATASGGDFQIFDETGQLNRLYIQTADGDVGLGTAKPETELHISGGIGAGLLLESDALSSIEFRTGIRGQDGPIWWGIFSTQQGDLSFFARPDLPCIGSCVPALRLTRSKGLQLGAVIEGDLRLDGEIQCLRQGIGGRPLPGCLGTGVIADRAITRTKLALDAVDASLLADNAVGSTELQANAVDSLKVKDGSLGAADVNASQVQRRVAKACPAGSSIRGISIDGAVECDAPVCVAGSGKGAVVCGASSASGGSSFASGSGATAKNAGAFVWADSSKQAFSSTANNEFSARATGGVRFVSSLKGVGVRLAPGGASWSSLSDRDLKENFAELDGREIMERLARVPIRRWNLKSQAPEILHLGPTAQDFFAAFSLGESDRYISTSDADGIALISIQTLYRIALDLERKTREVEEKTEQLEGLRERLETLERSVTVLQAKQ